VSAAFRTYSGTIAYVGDGEVGERGRERFHVTVHDNGDRTINARCEIDDAQVVRDVVYSVDGDWKPIDAFIRLNVKGRFMGSGWFHFTDQQAECETFMAEGGRVSQSMSRAANTQAEHAVSFGAHPVACDVWHLGVHQPVEANDDKTAEDRKVRIHTAFMSSLLPNGASGPMLSTMTFGVEQLDDEILTVRAGTFPTHHYRYIFDDGHPDEHVWYTTQDRVLVKIRWDLLSTTYELVEFTR
jgi:hypothetical protein